MTMNIEEMNEKAAEARQAVRFAYIHRRLPLAEISNPSDLANLTMIDMLDAIRAASETSDSGRNIHRSDFDHVYLAFLRVVSIASHIPALETVREALEVEQCKQHLLLKEEAFEELSEELLIREFTWRVDRLVSGLCSLPIKVVER
jgi:hypothetical protein